MAANVLDKFTKASSGTRPTPTTLTALLASGASPGTATCNALTGWPTDTAVYFCIYTIDANGNKTSGSQTDWRGVVSGSTITNLALVAGTNSGYSVGAVVEASPVAGWADALVTGLTNQHSQLDGSHTAVTATSLSVSGNTTHTGTTTLVGALTLNSWDGWITSTDTWTYASATTFTIAGVDRTAQFPVGTKLKLTQTTAKYFYVVSAAFSTNTTVTVTGGADYSLANAAITAPNYSYEANPQGFPQWFAFTPVYTGFSADPSGGTVRFNVIERTVNFRHERTTGGTSNATTFTMTLPIQAKTLANAQWTGAIRVQNNGAFPAAAGLWQFASAATTAAFFLDQSGAAFTAANAKNAQGLITYEI